MLDVDAETAHKRALEDYSQFSQFARTAAQFTFGANGGAAAAVLSFLTTTVNSAVKTEFDRRLIVHNFSIGCSFYVAGILVAAISMYFFARSKKRWGDAWEDAAFTGKYSFESQFAVAAQKLEDIAWLTLIVSAAMLAAGSFFSLFGFLKQ
jgi:multidrug efflux pump subunit AcrB